MYPKKNSYCCVKCFYIHIFSKTLEYRMYVFFYNPKSTYSYIHKYNSKLLKNYQKRICYSSEKTFSSKTLSLFDRYVEL